VNATVTRRTVSCNHRAGQATPDLPAGMRRKLDLTIIRQFIQHTIEIFVKRMSHWTPAGKGGYLFYNPSVLGTIVGIIVDEGEVFQRLNWDPGRLAAGVGIRGVDRRRIVHNADVAVRRGRVELEVVEGIHDQPKVWQRKTRDVYLDYKFPTVDHSDSCESVVENT